MARKRKTGGKAKTGGGWGRTPWVKTAEPLLWLTGAGHERQTGSWYYYDAAKRQDRPHWVFQMTLAGAGFHVDSRGRRTLLTPGMAFFEVIPGPFQYGYPPDRRDTYELLYFSLGGAEAHRWCERITSAHGRILQFNEQARQAIVPAALALAREVASRRLDRYMVSGVLYQLLMTILSELNSSRLAMQPLAHEAARQLSAAALTREVDVAALAERMGVSREHLSRAFRQALGVSPSEYLIQQRLRMAAQHLRTSDAKLETIARLSGFSGANYFVRAFKKHVGVTPAAFRRRPLLTVP